MVLDAQLERVFASIVIDEFAEFAMPLFVYLLNKGRSAGMAITISHQSLDLVRLDRLDMSAFAEYSPRPQDRAPSMGIDLRRRAARRGSSVDPRRTDDLNT